MPMISYAQNREDVVLARALPGAAGFYIDVGAADPVGHSVTKHFYEKGWSGVNVEPVAEFFARLEADRLRDVNLRAAIGETPGTAVLYAIPNNIGCATLEPDQAARVRAAGGTVVEQPVDVLTLVQVCERHAHGPIDFLKIDVEGHERAVLAGMDFARWRPRVLVVEATEPGSPTPAHADWEPLVLAAGYVFALFDGLNRFYARREEADTLVPRLAAPANVFDDYIPFDQVAAVHGLEARVAGLRGELNRAREADAGLRRELGAARADADSARGRADSQTSALAAAAADRDRAAAEIAGLLGELDRTRAAAVAERERLLAEAAGLTAELDRVRSEAAADRYRALSDITTLIDELDRARATAAAAAGRLADAEDALAAARAEVAAVRANAVSRQAYATAMTLLAATRAHLDQTRAGMLLAAR